VLTNGEHTDTLPPYHSTHQTPPKQYQSKSIDVIVSVYLRLCLLVRLGTLVAQCCAAQVTQPDASLAAAVSKQAAVRGVKIGTGDDLRCMSRGGEPAARENSRELVRKLGTIEIRQQECRQQECRQAAKPGY
jgi:hypothetical protein